MNNEHMLTDKIAQVFRERLYVEVPSEQTDLFAEGLLDSMGLVELLAILEEDFGARISPDTLEFDEFRSIARIANFVTRSVR